MRSRWWQLKAGLGLRLARLSQLCRLTTRLLECGARVSATASAADADIALCRVNGTMLTNSDHNEHNGTSGDHKTDKQLKCFWPKCQFKTVDARQLKEHYSVHQKSRNQFRCDANNCQKTFKYKQNLIQHKLSHKLGAKSLFVCDINDCRKSFGQKLQLIRHKATHNHSSAASTPALIYAHKSNVLVNSSRMSDENQSQVTANKSSLEHKRPPAKRPKDKRFICDYSGCDKCFDSKSNLERHKRIHSGEKPFGCDIAGCGQRFTQKTHLVQHKKRKHRIILPKNAIKLIKPLDDYKPVEEYSLSSAPKLVFSPSVASTPKPAPVPTVVTELSVPKTPVTSTKSTNNLAKTPVRAVSEPTRTATRAVTNSSETPTKACDTAVAANHRQYKCYMNKCGNSYDSLYELKTHVNSVHPNDSLNKCNESNCNQVFKSFYNLYYHKKTFHKL